MTSTELAQQIQLHPRAVVLTGTLRERTKNSAAGPISGYTPHYAARGCPPVPFNGDTPAGNMQEGAAIEADLTEQPSFMPGMFTSYGRPLNMVHLVFGSNGNQPNDNQLKLLREAGQIMRPHTGSTVHLVAVPVITAGAYGVANGRLYMVGLFSVDGQALFIHPDAQGSLIKAAFPAGQKQRTTLAPVSTPAPSVQSPAAATEQAAPGDWYVKLHAALGRNPRLKGGELHKAVLDTYAGQVILQGRATSKSAALKVAQQDFNQIKDLIAPASQPEEQTAPKARRLTSAKL